MVFLPLPLTLANKSVKILLIDRILRICFSMAIVVFIKKHSEHIKRFFAALALSALMAAFILAFRQGMLPFAEDGDAFDTIYAVEE